MKLSPRLRSHYYRFHDRHPLIGPIFWLLSVQYFVTQYFVAKSWTHQFSLAANTISDLGNTACTSYGGRYVCSPGHSYMNASFVVLGLAMLLGSICIYPGFRTQKRAVVGFVGMGIAGVGTLLVGSFPENTISQLHVLGAALTFIFGNLALLSFGLRLDVHRWLRRYSLLSGVIGLIGLGLFATNTTIGLGSGGVERLAAYPQTIWLIVFGCYMFRNQHLSARRSHSRAQANT